MNQYLIVQGIKGVLIGDPGHPQRFLCQRRKSWESGDMPKALHDRYEPIVMAYATKRAIEGVRKGGLVELGRVMATSAEDAMKKYEASAQAEAAPARKSKSKTTKVEVTE